LGVEFIELTKTLNISSSGACIASSHLLQMEQVIQLTIPTPSPSTSGLVPETPPLPGSGAKSLPVTSASSASNSFVRYPDSMAVLPAIPTILAPGSSKIFSN
jgi:hypothetical protein